MSISPIKNREIQNKILLLENRISKTSEQIQKILKQIHEQRKSGSNGEKDRIWEEFTKGNISAFENLINKSKYDEALFFADTFLNNINLDIENKGKILLLKVKAHIAAEQYEKAKDLLASTFNWGPLPVSLFAEILDKLLKVYIFNSNFIEAYQLLQKIDFDNYIYKNLNISQETKVSILLNHIFLLNRQQLYNTSLFLLENFAHFIQQASEIMKSNFTLLNIDALMQIDEHEKALELSQRLLEKKPFLTKEQLEKVYSYRSFSYFLTDNLIGITSNFTDALSENISPDCIIKLQDEKNSLEAHLIHRQLDSSQ